MEPVVRFARLVAPEPVGHQYRRTAPAQRAQRDEAFREQSISDGAPATGAGVGLAILVYRPCDQAQGGHLVASPVDPPLRSSARASARWTNRCSPIRQRSAGTEA